ncbi:MAG: (d)CMP kinase [Clostridia bacterium]|nr:(d)CMP kinase [Clostridia bacterium]
MSHLKIAVDGPGGAGKSSVCKQVARRLNLLYIDTGALYRTVGLYVKRAGIDPTDRESVVASLPDLKIGVRAEEGRQIILLDGVEVGDEIRTQEISMYASRVSAIPEVRAKLLDYQRGFAEEYDVILDGRDIGTVIFPDAQVKIFLTASPEARAHRRYLELTAKGVDVSEEAVLAEMNKRDRADSTRESAPLVAADDAVTIDTSDLDFEGSVEAVIAEIKAKRYALTPEKAKKIKKEKRSYRFFYYTLGWIIRFFHRIKVTGRENVPRSGGCILCSNHIAILDIFSIGASVPRPINFLAKRELFKVPVLSFLIRSAGAIPLERTKTDLGAIRRSVELAANGNLVAIFPQGHRQPGKNPADTEYKSGAALVAFRAGVPIVPICIRLKGQKYRIFRRTEIIIGKPMTQDELGLQKGGSEEYREATAKVFGEICRLGNFEKTLPAPEQNGPDA